MVCDTCREMSAQHVVHTYPDWVSEFSYYVCDECLPGLVQELKRNQREYRVGGHASSD